MRYTTEESLSRWIKIWLLAGLFMVFMQIALGGITRLTGSGLSITKWEVVRGTMPPLSEADWQSEFELYKATPQYEKINQGMTMSEFKFIYFWEYFHRLWARLMFFVFVIPFAWFLWRGMMARPLVPRLLVMVGLAGLEGFFGWIMVASGLIKRPWVNAYNLTLHLSLGLIIYAHLLWTYFMASRPVRPGYYQGRLPQVLVVLAFVQIALGALMSGTKAGLLYPTWPDMHGGYLPAVLFDSAYWNWESFTHYDTNPFFPTLIQFLHRNVAYLLSGLVVWFIWKNWSTKPAHRPLTILAGLLTIQVLLGIFTLLNCVGHIPVLLGVLHQLDAVALLTGLVYANYCTRRA